MTNPFPNRLALRSARRRAIVATLLTIGVSTSGIALSTGAGAVSAPGTIAVHRTYPAGRYIVQGVSASAVANAGGRVETRLPIIHGFVATLSGSAAAAVGNLPGARLTVDAALTLQGGAGPSIGSGTPVLSSFGGSTAYRTVTGANRLDPANDGTGVTVGVLDTGIDAALPDFGNRVVGGVDLTGGNAPFTDGYGHGTFVAGIIASNGVSSNGEYVGEAPGANLVSIKVADAEGSTTEGTVIAGIAWAVAHHTGVNGINVLNISLGVMPTTPAALDPLDQAVEFAWDAGIVVVVSAGNSGPNNGTITSPGDDPLVITVGALNDGGCVTTSPCTVNSANASIPSFSSVGPTLYDGIYKPDLVASGRSLVSLAVPGSTIALANPGSITGPNNANFVGSGTSFSAAVTSGAVALLLQEHPTLTPDQVKATLLGTTDPGPTGDPFVDGHGSLDIATAISQPVVYDLDQQVAVAAELHFLASTATVSLAQTWAFSTWDPALWMIRTASGKWQGAAWNGAAWNGAAWNGAAWNGAAWNGFFTGAAWNGAAWNGAAWNGAAWNGAAWNGAAWNGAAWNGAAWNGAGWNSVPPSTSTWTAYWAKAALNGAAWNSATWTALLLGNAWSGAAWNTLLQGAAWNGAAWNGAAWNGAAWNGAAWNGDSYS
jgi:serine protease AprX